MIDFDINCDLGEGLDNEKELMPFIDACNIACGGHAGDVETIKRVLDLATEYKVKVGAHPSFVDREHFGRKELTIEKKNLVDQLVEQVDLVRRLAATTGTELNHVKPHGALYNMAARSEEMASAVIEAVSVCGKDLLLFVPPNSVVAKMASHGGLRTSIEVFADRNYTDNFDLVSRKEAYAVIDDPLTIEKRMIQMAQLPGLISYTGRTMKLYFDTVCLHGDHEKALENAQRLQKVKDLL